MLLPVHYHTVTPDEIAILIINALDKVYVTVDGDNTEGDAVNARVDVKPKLLSMIAASPKTDMATFANALSNTLDVSDAEQNEGNIRPVDDPELDMWFVDLNGPGTLTLDDVLLCAEEATVFDLPSMFVTLCGVRYRPSHSQQ